MLNLTCEEGGVLKRSTCSVRGKLMMILLKWKFLDKKKCLRNLKIRYAELNQDGGVPTEVDLFWKREIDSNVINIITMS